MEDKSRRDVASRENERASVDGTSQPTGKPVGQMLHYLQQDVVTIRLGNLLIGWAIIFLTLLGLQYGIMIGLQYGTLNSINILVLLPFSLALAGGVCVLAAGVKPPVLESLKQEIPIEQGPLQTRFEQIFEVTLPSNPNPRGKRVLEELVEAKMVELGRLFTDAAQVADQAANTVIPQIQEEVHHEEPDTANIVQSYADFQQKELLFEAASRRYIEAWETAREAGFNITKWQELFDRVMQETPEDADEA